MSVLSSKQTCTARETRVSSISSSMLLGIAVLTVLIAALTWITNSQLQAQARSREIHKLNSSIELIASQAELAIQDADLPRVRRLLIDAQTTGDFHRLSVQFANDQTLVSTDLGETYRDSLPDSWGRPALPFEQKSRLDPSINQLTIFEPLQIAGHEHAVLIAESMPIVLSSLFWRYELSAMVAGLSGLILGFLAYLQIRQRPAPLLAIRSALSNFAQGYNTTQDLLVSGALGPETRAFNSLLEERDALITELAMLNCEHSIRSVSADSFGLSSVCAALTQGMVVLDANLNIQFINGSAAAYLGADLSTTIGKQLAQIDPDSVLVPRVHAVLNPESPRRQSFDMNLEQSSSVLRSTCVRIHRDQDILCLVLFEDVTQQRHADEALNSFIAQATHELRTPLTNIRLYAEEAIDAGSDDEEFRSNAFNMINSESRRLERLVSDMLCVSELEAGSMNIRMETVRPESLFEDLQRDYAPQAESKRISLVFDLPPKFPSLEADRDRLGQAIHNLIGNALKYTPSEGEVTVKVEFDPADTMTVRVSDSGIGISLEDQSRIFERYCRAEDQRIESISGTGLGLAITQEIVNMHGGSLEVESELDQGSTFILTIPSGRSQMSNAA